MFEWLNRIASPLVSFLLVVAAMTGGWVWLSEYEEMIGLEIRAPHDLPEQGLPVFAQFTVTQRISLDKPLEAVWLEVPIYWPEDSEWLKIDLLQDGELRGRWRVKPPEQDVITETQLPLAAPVKLAGDLEVKFSGEHIAHEDQQKAPRIFIESADYVFPDGNYRIAENEKEGDVALAFTERLKRRELLKVKLSSKPAEFIADVSRAVLLGVLLGVFLPSLVNSARDSEK